MTKQELLDKANDLPLAPGVYLMMDKTGCVIYVGKAKKLKNRVSQYFQENSSHNEKTRRMVSQVDHFDTIFVSTEFEALILENSLIKQHMPRYNILLKDDKGYPFVRLGTEHYPRFTMASKPADDNALYFGPFGGRNETRAAIDAMKLPDMLGCISGNDAVAIVARGEQEAERLCYDLRQYCK
jgi:excinuclease ABC subunit C